MATFSLLLIVVLVNLLIAMMSKTHDSVVEAGVREREWQFYQTTVWVKFIRREFVAPAPVNIIPNFYRHLFDPVHSIWAKLDRKRQVNGKEDLSTNDVQVQNISKVEVETGSVDVPKERIFAVGFQLDLLPEVQKEREERYATICDVLLKRYKAEYLNK